MSSVTRRGFLRAMSAIAASVAIPVPQFVLAESGIIVPHMPIELGTIRTLAQYTIHRDEYVVRLDALNRRTQDQFHVDFAVRCNARKEQWRDKYIEARNVAESVLADMMRHHGWRADELISLPVPHGYAEPDWMRAARG